MRSWGPYPRNGHWRVAWELPTGARRSATVATLEEARALMQACDRGETPEPRRHGKYLPKTKPRKKAESAPTTDDAAELVATRRRVTTADIVDPHNRNSWLEALADLLALCMATDDDILRKTRTMTPIFAVAHKFLETGALTKRLEELERAMSTMRSSKVASPDQRGTSTVAGAAVRSEPAIH